MNALLSLSTPEMGALPSLAAAFEACAQRRGQALAVRCDDEDISYQELDRLAERVALAIRRRGIGRQSLIALLLPRSVGMIVAMLGVCKAGAAYLPLDPTFPSARLQDVLTDAKPALLITDEVLQSTLQRSAVVDTLLLREALSSSAPAGDRPFDCVDIAPDDLAYVIYTSGSTGTPKGVMVSHGNVLRLFSQTAHWFDFHEQDVWTMFHSFAFDFSVWEIWGALLTGGTLVIVPYTTSRSPENFYSLLSRERVTILNQTPTAFGLLSRAVEGNDLPLALRYVVFGGEALGLRSLHSWVRRFGDAHPQLINMYGITETTVHVTYRRVFAADVERETESLIGEPIPDLQVHLLNDDLQPVVAGEVGEIYVGGAGVALGYLGKPELTAERFLREPATGKRLYRSGDLARVRPDGELVYAGRADRQIKINGFRIEPAEIEATLAALPGVRQVCVTARGTAAETPLLIAYFTATETMDHRTLAAQAEGKLPKHMWPSFYMQLPCLPLTSNGKVDYKALPVPEPLLVASSPVVPTAPLAQQIATLWSSLLQTGSASEAQNFFDAGGTSLQLMALRTVLQQKLGRSIPILWLFEHTTPERLARKLQEDGAPAAELAAARIQAKRQRQSFARARTFRSTT